MGSLRKANIARNYQDNMHCIFVNFDYLCSERYSEKCSMAQEVPPQRGSPSQPIRYTLCYNHNQ